MIDTRKDTVVGRVPTCWDVRPLEEVSDFITKGGTPTTYGFDWADESTGVPFFRSECVTDEGFNPKGMNFIAAEAHLQMSRSEVKPGDLLMTITGNIGRVAKASGQFPTANINQHIARIRVLSDGRADVDFIYQCLKHEGYATYYRAILTGQAYPQISLQQVRGTPVALPPLPEQQKIAAILTTVDDKLDVIARQIDATQTLKQGLMQTLFSRGVGTQDVSGRWVPHTEFKESELGVIPVGWNFHRLDDLAHKITDGTHKTPSYTTQGIPFLRVTDIKGGDINFSNIKFISENEHLELIKRCKPEKGDVLLSKNGTIGIAREVDWSFEFSIFVSLCLIKVKPLLLSRYLTNLFEADLIKRQIKNQSKQGAVTNLHLEEIRKFQIPLPPVAEQQKIVDILDVVDARFAGLLAKQVQYQTLKRGLMQKLLTGEWRVSLGTHQDTAIAA